MAACSVTKVSRILQFSVSLFLTAHSPCGMDDRVKLPNLTDQEVNWRELEDLYSINESLYECRPDHSPSLDNWANFQKDLDKMFALRHVLKQFNGTHKLDDSTLPELGSGAGGGRLEEGSGEDLSDLAAEAHLATPAPSKMPPALHAPRTTLTRKMESVVNDLPERLSDRPAGSVISPVMTSPPGPRGHRVVLQSNMWAQLEEIEAETFSGNGLMELETRHENLLRTHNSVQAQLESGQGPGEAVPLDLSLGFEEHEDIFQAQGFLPFSLQTLRPTVQSSTTRSAPTKHTRSSQSVGSLQQVLPQSALPPIFDHEGSGSLPRPSNQTL